MGLYSWNRPGITRGELRSVLRLLRECACGLVMLGDLIPHHHCQKRIHREANGGRAPTRPDIGDLDFIDITDSASEGEEGWGN